MTTPPETPEPPSVVLPPQHPIALATAKLPADIAKQLRDGFGRMAQQVDEAEKEAATIIVTDASHTDAMKRAGLLRRKVKQSRCDAEHIRKELKRGYDEGGRAINGVAKLVNDPCEKLEAELLEKETFVEIQARKAQEERSSARRGECNEAGIPVADYYSQIENFAAEQWKVFVQGQKDAIEAAKIRAAKEAEAARIERERVAALEAENKRLAKEAADAARAKRMAEFRAQQEAAKAAAAVAAEAKRVKDEADRVATEHQRKLDEAAAEKQRVIDAANAEALRVHEEIERLRAEEKAAADKERKRVAAEAQAKIAAESAKAEKERKEAQAAIDRANAETRRVLDLQAAAERERERLESERNAKRKREVEAEIEADRLRKEAEDEARAAAMRLASERASYTYPLFEHMSREHGLTLIESELAEIMRICREIEMNPK